MENQNMGSGSKKNVMSVVILLVLVFVGSGVYFMLRPADVGDTKPSPTVTPQATVTVLSPTPAPSVSVSPVVSPSLKTFNVTGSNFSFSLKEIKVKKGDRVKIVFKNSGGMHDWVIDEFKTRTPILQSGQTAEVEFVADKAGTFQYYCSVGSHRANGMWGNLIVE